MVNIQRYSKAGRDLWPERDDRPRAWFAHDTGTGGRLLRKYAAGDDVPDPDYPPTIELDADEWGALATDPAGGVDLDDSAVQRQLDALAWPGEGGRGGDQS